MKKKSAKTGSAKARVSVQEGRKGGKVVYRRDIAADFDPTKSYSEKNLCYYRNDLYRCVNDHQGEWGTGEDFELASVEAVLETIESGGGGTSDYADLSNKPKIENHELAAGNNTAASLGIASTADATLNKVSEEWTFIPATFERDDETYQWSEYTPNYRPEEFEYEGTPYAPGWYGLRPDGEPGPYSWSGDGPDALTVSTNYNGAVVATRAAAHGLRLGPNSVSNPNRNKPLASEQEAADLRTAVAGKQAALGYTPENAANKVTSLSAQSTDTQYPSAKCVYDALANVDAKPTRIYNAAGTDALDDKGNLYRSDIISDSGNYFYRSGYGSSYYQGTRTGTYDGVYQTIYIYGGDDLAYIPSSGNIYEWNMQYGQFTLYQVRMTATPHLDPTSPGANLNVQMAPGAEGLVWTYTPRTIVSSMIGTPYARFALEAMPTAWTANTTYTVGVCVSYGGKAYRCKAATASSDTTAPSSDTTHWTEIPTLDGVKNALSGNIYDFNFNSNIVRALADVVEALGGTVNNNPTDGN